MVEFTVVSLVPNCPANALELLTAGLENVNDELFSGRTASLFSAIRRNFDNKLNETRIVVIWKN